MSDRNVARALSRSGLSSPPRIRRLDRRVEIEQRRDGRPRVAAGQGREERPLEVRHLVAGAAPRGRRPAGRRTSAGAARRAPAAIDHVGGTRPRPAPGPPRQRLDRHLAPAREDRVTGRRPGR